MNKAIWIASGMMVCLAGCATPYQRQGYTGGYSEVQLSEDSFKVSFRGNGYTASDKAADMALLRSAEVALEHGFTHFVIIDERSSESRSTYTTPTTTNASAYAYGNSAYGTATTYGGQTFLISKPRSTNLILCFREKPVIQGMVYDAEFLSRSMRQSYQLKPN